MITLLLAALVVAVGDGLPADALPVKAPASVGMSAARLKVINHLVSRGIDAGGFPGAAVIVGRNGVATWEKGYGRLDWSSRSPRVSPTNTLYDLASLTKVVATTTAIMILYDEGKIALDDPVARYLPTFTGGGKERVTIRLLLEHRSGLPPDRALWRIADS
ncbi:MAG TPA: serine hydrolase domain-containing protein, partial [Gemmatimonadaceae bacterium]|nr:serine hydrolase domain-containing protein [Gemmatimonadaceae bacterium]